MAQDASAKILRKINEAKRELVGKNVQGCLMQFKSGLEIAVRESILQQDKKAVQEAIEGLQNDIQRNQIFKDVYGPVTFKGSEFEVTLEFLKQLIQASAEELFESTDLAQMKKDAEAESSNGEKEAITPPDRETIIAEIMKKIDGDDLDGAREMIGGDEEVMDRVVDLLNNNGISLRSSGQYDQALSVYSKGIELRPNEEGLYYNMARAFFEKGDKPGALDSLEKVLKINPDFGPGKDLRGYIQGRQKSTSGRSDEPAADPEGKAQASNGKKGLFSALKGLIGKKAE